MVQKFLRRLLLILEVTFDQILILKLLMLRINHWFIRRSPYDVVKILSKQDS